MTTTRIPEAIGSYEDIIDVRDVIARIDWLDEDDPDDTEELASLTELMDGLKGLGGDEQWNGDWYPGLIIRDSYFEDYAIELAEDSGHGDRNLTWPTMHIDWTAAAESLQMDYTTVEFEGVTYWTR